MNDGKIETLYDLKRTLETIIDAINEKNSLFSNASDDEQIIVHSFVDSLAKKRIDMKSALSAHYNEIEVMYDEFDVKVARLREKINTSLGDFKGLRIPDHYDIKKIKELGDALDLVNSIPPTTWNRIKAFMDSKNQ